MPWKRLIGMSVAAMCGLALTTSAALAGNNLLGNGYPSGPHFNLIILGKKPGFVCPTAAEYIATTPAQNVIYVPQVGTDVKIMMESGAKGPKNDPTLAVLKVTDWCSDAFDGTPAVVQIPKDPEGYAAFARIHGKPGPGDGSTASFEFTTRELDLVQDEFGNDLLVLGVVDDEGVTDISGTIIERFDTGSKGKGAKKATDISALFEYTGQVCAINNQDGFCSGDSVCSPGPTVCCVPVEEVAGAFVEASGCNDPDLAGFAGCALQVEVDGVMQCPDQLPYNGGLTSNVCEVITACKTFDGAWIFNIADFVNVLFGADNEGSYNVQVRLYPLPLINNQ
jgi:hypothetical protein